MLFKILKGIRDTWDPFQGLYDHSSKHTVSGNHLPASETPFKWRFAGEPMVAHLHIIVQTDRSMTITFLQCKYNLMIFVLF